MASSFGQTDRQTDGRIAGLLNAPYRRRVYGVTIVPIVPWHAPRRWGPRTD